MPGSDQIIFDDIDAPDKYELISWRMESEEIDEDELKIWREETNAPEEAPETDNSAEIAAGINELNKINELATNATDDTDAPALAAIMSRLDTITARLDAHRPPGQGITAPPEKKGGITKAIADAVVTFIFVAFLMLLAALVILTRGADTGAPRVMFGYSVMTVLTGSMTARIPADSLVVVRNIKPEKIVFGDDITFMKEGGMTVTHRVIDVKKDEASGEYIFTTQGVSNPKPDAEPVYGANIVGRVVFHIPYAGKVFRFIGHNILISVGLAAMIIALFYVLKLIKNQWAATRQGI